MLMPLPVLASEHHGQVTFGGVPVPGAVITATQGDNPGMLDIQWNTIKRGASSYTIQISTDPAGLTGWTMYGTSQKSRAELTGLVSGTRYWIRVCANGAAGPGPWSDPTTKTAP